MDIVYSKPECRDIPVAKVQPERTTHRLEFTNWKEEDRRRKIETKNWIKQRGYRKPDSLSFEENNENRNRKIKPEVHPFRNMFRFVQSEDERFNKEIEYWKQFISNSNKSSESRQKGKVRTG